MSIDGYLDTATDELLVLSNDADLDRVDAARADSDAILVGAATLRNDNPAAGAPQLVISVKHKVTNTLRRLTLRTALSLPTMGYQPNGVPVV
jgi:RibD C-terminal domain